jgi:hypothetical protein
MTTIIITPKTKDDIDLLTLLFKKMKIEAQIFEEPEPNDETLKAINEVNAAKGTRAESSKKLFKQLGI